MPKGLLTTTVGSFPNPESLKKVRADFVKGIISKEELNMLELKETANIIKVQNELRIDILVDGEFYRGDMVAYFAENITGFKMGGLVRSYGNRYKN